MLTTIVPRPRPGLLLLALMLMVFTACQRPERHGLYEEEALRVVWYLEDVAHGLPRSHDELHYDQASPALFEIARWARGHQQDGRQLQHPEPLRSRRTRWPLLAQALADGHLGVSEGGHLQWQPGQRAEAEFPEILKQARQQENLDRATSVEVVLGMGGLRDDARAVARVIEAFQAARRQHAVAAGGKAWTRPSPSNSDSEATPSTSEPDFSPRREP